MSQEPGGSQAEIPEPAWLQDTVFVSSASTPFQWKKGILTPEFLVFRTVWEDHFISRPILTIQVRPTDF